MNRHCPHCGEDLVPEPGFYQGALYMSYAFYVLLLLLYFFVYTWFFNDQYDYFLITIVPAFVLMTPLAYRLARRSWLALFIRPRQA